MEEDGIELTSYFGGLVTCENVTAIPPASREPGSAQVFEAG